MLAFCILLVVEAFGFNRLPSGSWRGFTSFRWRCLGKSNIVGTGFAFVGPNPPSKCLEHIGVCPVTFRLSSRHAGIYLRRLSCSLIPGAYCIFSLFCGKQWKVTFATSGYLTFFFLFLAVRTVVGTTVMFRHFHAKCLEIAKQNSKRLPNFSPHEPRIHVHGPTRPRAVGKYEYRLFIVPN